MIPRVSALAALGRNIWWLVGLTITAGIIAFVGLSIAKPMYTSEAKIAILDPRSGAPDAAGLDGDAIKAHVNALQSPKLAERIAAELLLVSLPEFNNASEGAGALPDLLRLLGAGPMHTADSAEDRALAVFAKRLSVRAFEDGRTIAIRFTAADRGTAAEVANRLSEVYREHLVAYRAEAYRRSAPYQVQIVARAQPAGAPTISKPLPNAIAIMLAVLLMSSSLLIARELVLGPPMRSARRGPPALIHQPQMDAGRAQSRDRGPPTDKASDGAIAAGEDQEQTETIASLVQRLMALQRGPQGVRTLLVGANTSIDPSAEAIDLARAIARQERTVVLIDWSLDHFGVAQLLGVPSSPGIAELIQAKAGFGETIDRMLGTAAHLIVSGSDLVSVMGSGDADRVNLMLDTLDAIYDQILIVARYNAARDLFETIEGRFDAGVMVGQLSMRLPSVVPVSGNFLGFEVDGLEILRLARSSRVDTSRGKKLSPKAA